MQQLEKQRRGRPCRGMGAVNTSWPHPLLSVHTRPGPGPRGHKARLFARPSDHHLQGSEAPWTSQPGICLLGDGAMGTGTLASRKPRARVTAWLARRTERSGVKGILGGDCSLRWSHAQSCFTLCCAGIYWVVGEGGGHGGENSLHWELGSPLMISGCIR